MKAPVPPYPVGCASGCSTVIEIRDVKVEDAVQTMEFKGWEWFPRVGWVCPSCQKARP